jgi:hypothetical protein
MLMIMVQNSLTQVMIRTVQMPLPSLTVHLTATTKCFMACHSHTSFPICNRMRYRRHLATHCVLTTARGAVSHTNKTLPAILCFCFSSSSFSLLYIFFQLITYFTPDVVHWPPFYYLMFVSSFSRLSHHVCSSAYHTSGCGGFKTNGVSAHFASMCVINSILAYFPYFDQEVLGRTNRLLSLIQQGPHWIRRVQQSFYRCVCIRYRGSVPTKPLPSNDRGIFTEPLFSNDKGIFTEPLPSNDRTHTHIYISIYIYRQQRDLINLVYFFKIKKLG